MYASIRSKYVVEKNKQKCCKSQSTQFKSIRGKRVHILYLQKKWLSDVEWNGWSGHIVQRIIQAESTNNGTTASTSLSTTYYIHSNVPKPIVCTFSMYSMHNIYIYGIAPTSSRSTLNGQRDK